MTKFYFLHVQTVLKITSSAVQTRFSRLEQSLSWIFMKSAVIKITAYWGRTPPQKSDRSSLAYIKKKSDSMKSALSVAQWLGGKNKWSKYGRSFKIGLEYY